MAEGEDKLLTAEQLIGTNLGELEEIEKQDRSHIAQRVVWLYVGVTAAIFIFVFAFFLLFPGCGPGPDAVSCSAWQEPAEFLLKVLTSVVLPIVTLVLGYYFGTAKVKD